VCGPAQELRRRPGATRTSSLKILGNVDALDAETGAEMRRLGEYLQATPMVIGIRTRDELKPGVVYFRHGVPVINPDGGTTCSSRGCPAHLRGPGGALRQPRRRPAGRRARGARLVARPSRHRTRRLATHRLEVRRRDERLHRGGGDQLEDLFNEPFSSPVDVLDGAGEVRDADPTPRRPRPTPTTSTSSTCSRTRDSRSTRPPGRRSRPSRTTGSSPRGC